MRGRILVVTSNFPRWKGDSTTPFVLHLAKDLLADGWFIDVLAPHADGAATREHLDDVTVERFRYLWPPSAQTVCYGGGALVNLRASKRTVAKVPALVLAELVATLQRLRSRRYDLIHTHWILPQGFTGAVASQIMGKPHVLTVHGGDVFALQHRALQGFKRYAVRHAHAVTANGTITAKAVRAIAPDVRDLRVIPMGVNLEVEADPQQVKAIRKRHLLGKGPLVVFIGRLVEEKGVDDLITAIAYAKDRLDVTGLIVGEGQHRARFEQLADQLGVADRVSFRGWAPQNEVASYLAGADIVAAPSRRARDGWVEAQGLSIVEAMAHRKPIIATNSGGIPDVITHERTGLLVPENDPGALAAAIERLYSDPAFAESLGREAGKVAGKRFSRTASARAFSALFEDVLTGRGQLR
jgi:phosphatidylinositol alpha-1,6-mannosyltransferase